VILIRYLPLELKDLFSTISGAIEMPSTVTYTGLVNYIVLLEQDRYCYQTGSILSDLNKTKLLTRSNPVVVLKQNNIK
jgi:hypothetical protein